MRYKIISEIRLNFINLTYKFKYKKNELIQHSEVIIFIINVIS